MTFSNRQPDIAIVGGGIIGLAIAMRMTQEYPRLSVTLLEKESSLAQHQTGHNSGVIHAGIYYAPGSQKANLCATGAKMLRNFCDVHGIEYKMCGKIITATSERELPVLEELFRRGKANGAEGLEIIDEQQMKEIEPHAVGVKAILSPNTGIIDYLKVAQGYAKEAKVNGADLVTDAKVRRIVRSNAGIQIETSQGDIVAQYLINCAGLHADRIARMMGIDTGVRIIPFRGEYFSIRPERAGLVRGLIYPVPDPRMPFLGVHFTRRINGGVEAGPNAVLAFAREGYNKTSFRIGDALDILTYTGFFKMARTYWKTGVQEQYRSMVKSAFVRSLQALVPDVQSDDLYEPAAGVRAQAVDRQGKLVQDFSISRSNDAIHVLNAPSPGATSSLAISRHIVDLACDSFDIESSKKGD